MSSFNSLSVTYNSAVSVDFTASFTSSATSNTFRYRLKVEISPANVTPWSANYCYSDYVSTNSVTTFTLEAGFGLLSPNTTYNITATIEYYDTGASSPSWQESSLSRTTTHTTGGISEMSTSTTSSSITVSWKWTATYSSNTYFRGFLEAFPSGSDIGSVVATASGSSASYIAGGSVAQSMSYTLTGLSPNTFYDVYLYMSEGPSNSSLSEVDHAIKVATTAIVPATGSITGYHDNLTSSSVRIFGNTSFDVNTYPYYYQVIFRVYVDQTSTLVYDDQTIVQTILSGASNPYTDSDGINVSGLSEGTTYQYQVVLYGGSSQSNLLQLDYDEDTFTTPSSYTPVSGTISNIQATPTSTGATILWTFTPDASTTDYYRGHVTLGTSTTDTTSVASKYSSVSQGNNGAITFTVQFSGLSQGTRYYYHIDMEEGVSTQTMSSIAIGHVGYFTTTLSPPSGTVTASVNSTTNTSASIRVQFSPSSSTTYYYKARIFYWPSDASEASYTGYEDTSVSSSSGSAITWSATSLTNLYANTTYYYRVYVYYGTSQSSVTNDASISTSALSFTTKNQVIAGSVSATSTLGSDGKSGSLSISFTGTGQNQVSQWTAKCVVVRSGQTESGGANQTIAISDTTAHTWTYSGTLISNLDYGTTYSYEVRIINNDTNEQVASKTVTLRTQDNGGGWTSGPSASQHSGAYTIDYSATWERTGTITSSISYTITVTDEQNRTIATSTQSVLNGALSISGTSSYTYSEGSHTLTFTVTAGGSTKSQTSKTVTVSHVNTQTIGGTATLIWTPTTENSGTLTATFRGSGQNEVSAWTATALFQGNNQTLSNNESKTVGVSDTSAKTWTVSVTGLNYSTQYTFTVSIRSGTTASTEVASAQCTFTTGAQQITPLLKWSWSQAFGSWNISYADATQAQTSAAELACTNKTSTRNFHHKVWNDIVEWLEYCLITLGVSYTASDVTTAKMSPDSVATRTLTATRWNALKNLFNTLLDDGLSGTGSDFHMSTAQSGQAVYGSMFVSANTGIVSVMNDYIDEHNSGQR